MGRKDEPEYLTWTNMKTRCYNRNNAKFEIYGARGIQICPRWRGSYEAFLLDMGRRPSSEHTIERIDNNGDYVPENCRWATPTEQARNRRTNRYVTVGDERLTLVEWAERSGVDAETIAGRLNRGWPTEKAVNTPVCDRDPATPLSLTLDSVTLRLHEWSKRTGLSASCISRRLKRGWAVREALTRSLDKRGGKQCQRR